MQCSTALGLSNPQAPTGGGGSPAPRPEQPPAITFSEGVSAAWKPASSTFDVFYPLPDGNTGQVEIAGTEGRFLWLVEPSVSGLEGWGNTRSITGGSWVSVTAAAPQVRVSVRETDLTGTEIASGPLPFSREQERTDNATGLVAVVTADNGQTVTDLSFDLVKQGTLQPSLYFGDSEALSFQWDPDRNRITIFEADPDGSTDDPAAAWWLNNKPRVVRWHRLPAIGGTVAVGETITIEPGIWSAVSIETAPIYTLTRAGVAATVTLPLSFEIEPADLQDGIALSALLDNGAMSVEETVTILEPAPVEVDLRQVLLNIDPQNYVVASGGTGPEDPFLVDVTGLGAPYDGTGYVVPVSDTGITVLVEPSATGVVGLGETREIRAPLVAVYGSEPATTTATLFAGATAIAPDITLPYAHEQVPGDDAEGLTVQISIVNGSESITRIVTVVPQASTGELSLISQDDPNTYLATGLAPGPVHILELPGKIEEPEYVTIMPSTEPDAVGWYEIPKVTGGQLPGDSRIVQDGKAYNLSDHSRAVLTSELRRGADVIATDLVFPFTYLVQPGDEVAGVTLFRTVSNGSNSATEKVNLVAQIGQSPVIESATTAIEIIENPYGDGVNYQRLMFQTGGTHLFEASRGGLIDRALLVGGGSSGQLQLNANRGVGLAGNGGEVVEFANQLTVVEGLNSIYVGHGGAGTVTPAAEAVDSSVSPKRGEDTVAFGQTARGASATQSGSGFEPGQKWDGDGPGNNYASGGGAGAGGPGGDAKAQFSSGDAGIGVISDITGEPQMYGAGANGIPDSSNISRAMGSTHPNGGASANGGTPPRAGTDGFGGGGGGTSSHSNLKDIDGMGAAKGGDGGIYIMVRI